MKRLTKTIALCMTLVFGSSMVFADVVDKSQPIDVTASVPSIGSTTLTVTVVGNINSFPLAGLTLAKPWIKSDGSIKIGYSSTKNAITTGIRLISKNSQLTADPTKPISNYLKEQLVDADYDGANDDKSYGGLIWKSADGKSDDFDLGTDGEDPSRRVTLAWQVYNDVKAGITVPSVTIGPDPVKGGTVVFDKTGDTTNPKDGTADVLDADTVGCWNSAWAYVSDINDDLFPSTVWNYTVGKEGPQYPMAIFGFSEGYNGFLTWHPMDTGGTAQKPNPRPADGEVMVYLAGRFANTNWGKEVTDKPKAYVLPAGDYRTKLYVELLYE